ncbi:hypothetical protein NIES37_73030 (plasmid) [Tolypothrix tenuis PCC 7101]|uniref:Primase 2 n=1 Tax=Tolypothrix tenuis PCC 7101 TaxID=231146 RepID=A0A1Z4NC59_9CYAN|nr:AAA family ATPase [Nostoc linckia FACHB-104]MBD2240572.1 AAA family ATPase [Aulosira sp. FACHB-113]BAZ03290.1 hypothetical protein NIES37_73030 [Tolypothrix tenuis PCC 7101]BAZ78684.1 hypothetical protein NIES50_73170 [Aulosira laxa NIES-50]
MSKNKSTQLIETFNTASPVQEITNSSELQEVSKYHPCPHCSKPDWCYRIGDLTVCKRGAKPAPGWQETSTTDNQGTPYYAYVNPKKELRPKSKKEFVYVDRQGKELIKVTRIDNGEGKKKFYQSHWDGKEWIKGLTDEVKSKVLIYRYPEVRAAIAEGKKIFCVEGEGIADLLWSLGLPATTTLGGSKAYCKYGNYSNDLKGADLVLCPDRDRPGVAYMADVAIDYPDAKWLYAPPNHSLWARLPDSGGLDIGDWIKDGATVEQIMDSISDRIKEWENLLAAVPSDKVEQAQVEKPQSTKQEAIEQARLILQSGLNEIEEAIQLENLREQANLSTSLWERKILPSLRRELQPKLLKIEIQAFLKLADPIEQVTQRSRIVSRYHLTNREFDQQCHAIRNAEKQNLQKPRLLTPKELFNLESENLDFLVAGYLPRFTSGLVSGLPGVGKSLLTIDLAYAIVTGGEFLGEKVKQGKVLIINSDQPLNITANYLSDHGFDEETPNLRVMGQTKDMAGWTIKDMESLEYSLEEFQPVLTIIDSIRATICYPLGIEEKSEIVGYWMKEVERLCIRYGSLLWVHHDNKDKDLSGVSRSSGSTAIPGNASFHWRLEKANKDDSDPNRIFSMPKTRGFEPVTLNLKYEANTGQWISQGRVGESPDVAKANQTLQQRILDFLMQRPNTGYTGIEIKEALGGSDSVYTILNRMVQRGIIGKRKSKSDTAKNTKVYFVKIEDTEKGVNTPPP